MRFTKGMKKALSFALSAALVLTSAGIAPKASADDAAHTGAIGDPDYKATMSVTASGPAISDAVGLDTMETWNANKNEGDPGSPASGCVFLVPNAAIKKIATYNEPMVKFMSEDVATVSAQEQINWGTISYEVNKATSIKDLVATYKDADWQGLAITVPCDATVSVVFYDAEAKTPEQIQNEEFDADALDEACAEAVTKIQKGTMKGFNLYGDIVFGSDWNYQYYGGNFPANGTAVTADGTYTIDCGTAEAALKGLTMSWIGTDLVKGTAINSDFSITLDKITVGKTDYTPLNEAKEIEDADGKFAYTAVNPRWGDTEVPLFSDVSYVNHAGETVTKKDVDLKKYTGTYRVNIKNPYNAAVKSLDGANSSNPDFFNPDCIDDSKGYYVDAFSGKTISTREGDKITMTVTVKGMTKATTTTPTTVKKTGKVSVSKSSVVVAPGKSTTVSYKLTKATGATATEAVTVSSSSSKVAKASLSGNKVKISVPKSATKGATATVKVKSGSKSATIKVAVQNKIKKATAAKKSVTVKKGKSVSVKVKLQATNKKKATTDTIKASVKSKKVAKVTKTGKASKSSVTIKVKGVKKGKTTLTVKVGSKKVKVSVKVK